MKYDDELTQEVEKLTMKKEDVDRHTLKYIKKMDLNKSNDLKPFN